MRELDQLALARLVAEQSSPSEIRWEQCQRQMGLKEFELHHTR